MMVIIIVIFIIIRKRRGRRRSSSSSSSSSGGGKSKNNLKYYNENTIVWNSLKFITFALYLKGYILLRKALRLRLIHHGGMSFLTLDGLEPLHYPCCARSGRQVSIVLQEL